MSNFLHQASYYPQRARQTSSLSQPMFTVTILIGLPPLNRARLNSSLKKIPSFQYGKLQQFLAYQGQQPDRANVVAADQ